MEFYLLSSQEFVPAFEVWLAQILAGLLASN